MNTSLPYVGISGVETIYDAQKIRDYFLNQNFSSSGKAQGAIGLCLTSDILLKKQTPPLRYITTDLLSSFYELPQDFGFIAVHYTPDLSKPLDGQIKLIVENIIQPVSKLIIQINNFIPDKLTLKKLKIAYPFINFILQINHSDELNELDNYLFSVLVDKSRGSGQMTDINQTTTQIKKIMNKHSGVSFGIAGGLTPENILETLNTLRGKLSDSQSLNISIDAESGLRNSKNKLSINKVKKYIINASSYYHSAQ